MSRSGDVEAISSGMAALDRIARENRTWLAERGETIVGSGCFRDGPLSLAIHSDYGPPHQDKPNNQDFALAWRPGKGGDGRYPSLVVAVADGLTDSFRSECASAVACWVSLRALVEADGTAAPRELALTAFNKAAQTLGTLADELAADPEASCPDGQFLSTWKYILKKGGLFQTTLTLAWLDRTRFCLAAIGDGGALWRSCHGLHEDVRPTDRILAACNLDSQQVNALGPDERYVRDFDCWREEPLDAPFACALMTDGIGRGIGADPFALLDELERLQAAEAENPAREFIAQAIHGRPRDFDDNVTLAVIRAASPPDRLPNCQ